MPIWKTTENITRLDKDGEIFDHNWMDFNHVSQYAPAWVPWDAPREIRVEDVEIWEVITEVGSHLGFTGVYAAYQPHAEFYVVTRGWSIVAAFGGPNANTELEVFLVAEGIPYPKC